MNIYDMLFNLKLELLIKSIDNQIILLSIFVIWYVLTMLKCQTRKTCLSNFRFKCDTMLYIKQSKHDMCFNVLKKKCSVEIELLYRKDSCWFQLWTNKPDLQREIRDDSIEYVCILYKKQMRSRSNQELNKYSHCKQNVCGIYIWIFIPRWFMSYEVLTYGTLEFQNAIYSHSYNFFSNFFWLYTHLEFSCWKASK